MLKEFTTRQSTLASLTTATTRRMAEISLQRSHREAKNAVCVQLHGHFREAKLSRTENAPRNERKTSPASYLDRWFDDQRLQHDLQAETANSNVETNPVGNIDDYTFLEDHNVQQPRPSKTPLFLTHASPQRPVTPVEMGTQHTRRPVKACGRCEDKKVRCDMVLPQCITSAWWSLESEC